MNPGSADKPLVSIVLPTYNRADVLPNAIRSVLAQTYEELELIIVDDNSADDTPAVVQSFSDRRVRYVRNDPNLKLPRALNKGFALARGDCLTWTSDDNLYAEDAIARMVERLQRGDCDLVYADYFLCSEQGPDGRPLDAHHDRLPDRVQLDKGNHIGACFLYTREVYHTIGDYDPDLFLVEDYDYFIRVAQHFRLCHITDPLYYFRRDDNTLYLSRFAEVKAADVLVRYKNGLVDEYDLIDNVVALIMRRMNGLKHPLLRWAYVLVDGRSYRAAKLHRHLTAAYLRPRIETEVGALLEAYRDRRASFGEARNALAAVMTRHGTVQY